MSALFRRFVREEAGQDVIEYVMLAGLISVIAVGAIFTIGTGVNARYLSISTSSAVAGS